MEPRVTASESFWFHAATKNFITQGMSDEPPPPLRLRLRPEPPGPPPSTPPAAASPEPVSAAPEASPPPAEQAVNPGLAKLRLKPKLTAAAPTAAPVASEPAPVAPPETLAAAGEPPAPPPVVPAIPIVPAVPAPAARAAHPLVALPSELSPVAGGDVPPPTKPLAPVPHVRAPEGVDIPEPEAPMPTRRERDRLRTARRKWNVLAAVVGIGAIGGGIYFAVPYFQQQPVMVDPNAAPKAANAFHSPLAPKVVGPATSGTTPPKPATTAPGQAVERARRTTAVQAGRQQDAATAGQEAPPPSAPALAVAPEPGGPPPVGVVRGIAPGQTEAVTQFQVAPGVTASSMSVVEASHASPEFSSWVANAQISGVFQGQPARVLINGRTVRAGEIVEPRLGIVFQAVDAKQKLLRFRDRSGATVQRKY